MSDKIVGALLKAQIGFGGTGARHRVLSLLKGYVCSRSG